MSRIVKHKQKSMGSKITSAPRRKKVKHLKGEALKRDIMRRYRITSEQYDRVIREGQKRNAKSE